MTDSRTAAEAHDAVTAFGVPDETLGEYIRRSREAAGISRAKLAGSIGVTDSAVGQWETDVTVPSARALHFIAAEIPGIDAQRLLALIPPTGPR